MPVWKKRPDDADELNDDGIHPVVAECGEMLIQASRDYERAFRAAGSPSPSAYLDNGEPTGERSISRPSEGTATSPEGPFIRRRH